MICIDSSASCAHKACSKCHANKPLTDYYQIKRDKPLKNKIITDGHKPMCKACYVARASVWRKANPEKRSDIVKKWKDSNVERRRESVNAHNAKESTKIRHKEWRLENATAYLKARRATDPMFAFKIKMRTIILKSFYTSGYTKRSKTNLILGCDWPTFIAHIERQFLPGMTWENRGLGWHIDHIRPMSIAETECDVVALNHHTNLRPMWASENLKKSDSITHLI